MRFLKKRKRRARYDNGARAVATIETTLRPIDKEDDDLYAAMKRADDRIASDNFMADEHLRLLQQLTNKIESVENYMTAGWERQAHIAELAERLSDVQADDETTPRQRHRALQDFLLFVRSSR